MKMYQMHICIHDVSLSFFLSKVKLFLFGQLQLSCLNLNINTRTMNCYVNSKRPNETECRHTLSLHIQLYIGYDNRIHTAHTAQHSTVHSILSATHTTLSHTHGRSHILQIEKLSRSRIALNEVSERKIKHEIRFSRRHTTTTTKKSSRKKRHSLSLIVKVDGELKVCFNQIILGLFLFYSSSDICTSSKLRYLKIFFLVRIHKTVS